MVFVTKYRRKTLTPELLGYLRGAFVDCLAAWRCHLIEFGGESDHVHLLIDIHPALNISVLINNLKTASARRARIRFAQHLSAFYSKPLFWHRAYYVGSVGGVRPLRPSAPTWTRRAPSSMRASPKQKEENRPLDPPLPGRLRLCDAARQPGRGRGMREHVFNQGRNGPRSRPCRTRSVWTEVRPSSSGL
ncbi:IS200/IS605 family transposase [Thiomonas sp. FB-Cd]|uniref:IS200/IS605 family transposase n=1 Tax=Thiomonas sp. FB-Cd TaxID=1158292 RepID=UPI0021007451|nr:IS200/IS605 family transposase [Thiomonas sp. FB-Cd]